MSNPAFVQKLSTIAEGNGVSSFQSVALSSPLTVGSTLIVTVWVGSSKTVSSITDTAGNAYFIDQFSANGATRAEVWRAQNLTSTASNKITVTVSGTCNLSFQVIECTPQLVMDVNSTHTGTTAQPSTGSFSTTHANEIIIYTFAANSNDGPSVSPSGFTTIGYTDGGGTVQDGGAAYEIVTSIQSFINPTLTSGYDGGTFACVGVGYRSAAIQPVQFATGTQMASNVITKAFTSNVTSGNILTCNGFATQSQTGGTLSVTDTRGTSYTIYKNVATASITWVAYGTAPSSGSNTVTVTYTHSPSSSGNLGIAVAEWAGCTTTEDNGSATSNNSGSASAPNPGSITTHNADDLIIAAMASSGSLSGTPGGYTPLLDSTAGSVFGESVYQLLGVTSSYNPTWASDPGTWSSSMVILQATVTVITVVAGWEGGFPAVMEGMVHRPVLAYQ